MSRLRCSVKRLEGVEAIDRTRRLSEEEGIWCEMMLTDPEVGRAEERR